MYTFLGKKDPLGSPEKLALFPIRQVPEKCDKSLRISKNDHSAYFRLKNFWDILSVIEKVSLLFL